MKVFSSFRTRRAESIPVTINYSAENWRHPSKFFSLNEQHLFALIRVRELPARLNQSTGVTDAQVQDRVGDPFSANECLCV